MYRSLKTLSILTLVVLATPVAFAATKFADFNVTASVAANCTISAADLSFGAYDPVVTNATTPLDVNGSVTVACTKGSSATIGLGQGSAAATGSTAVAPLRQMSAGTERLRYDLYRTSVGTGVWGDIGTANVLAYTATSKAATTLTIYGRVPAGQDVGVSASYTDTVRATINF